MSGREEAKIVHKEKAQKVTIILSIIIIICIAIMGIAEYVNRRVQSSVNELYDTTVVEFESYKTGLNNIVTLYSIWDLQSYQYAEQNCNISNALRKKIFTGFAGSNYTSKPTVTVTDIQYDLETSVDGVRTYYAILKINDKDRERTVYYNIIAYLKDETLIDYTVL